MALVVNLQYSRMHIKLIGGEREREGERGEGEEEEEEELALYIYKNMCLGYEYAFITTRRYEKRITCFVARWK